MNLIAKPIIFLSILVFKLGSANANSISFDTNLVFPNGGDINLEITYDFTDIPMFGGGFHIIYDPDALILVSYTHDVSGTDAQEPASPSGVLIEPGFYGGVGIGTFSFFTGINDLATFGTLVFESTGLGCNPCIQLVPDPVNPMVSLNGEDLTAEIFSNGITQVDVMLNFPIPAAYWFMLSGLAAVYGYGRKK